MAAKGGGNIALGAFDGGNLFRFAERVKGEIYYTWGATADDFIRVASNPKNNIHFNLDILTRFDGAASINIQHALQTGGNRGMGFTNWELRKIALNKE